MKKIILVLAIVSAGSAAHAQHIKHSTANESYSKMERSVSETRPIHRAEKSHAQVVV